MRIAFAARYVQSMICMFEANHVYQECKSSFVDGRYFLRQGGDEPYCPACEERRLKAF